MYNNMVDPNIYFCGYLQHILTQLNLFALLCYCGYLQPKTGRLQAPAPQHATICIDSIAVAEYAERHQPKALLQILYVSITLVIIMHFLSKKQKNTAKLLRQLQTPVLDCSVTIHCFVSFYLLETFFFSNINFIL